MKVEFLPLKYDEISTENVCVSQLKKYDNYDMFLKLDVHKIMI